MDKRSIVFTFTVMGIVSVSMFTATAMIVFELLKFLFKLKEPTAHLMVIGVLVFSLIILYQCIFRKGSKGMGKTGEEQLGETLGETSALYLKTAIEKYSQELLGDWYLQDEGLQLRIRHMEREMNRILGVGHKPGRQTVTHDTHDKMKQIYRTYQADEEVFGLLMFKYENTFKDICETLDKAESVGKLTDEKMLDKVATLISYPYEEIVQAKTDDWLYKGLDKEHEILEELKKNQGAIGK